VARVETRKPSSTPGRVSGRGMGREATDVYATTARCLHTTTDSSGQPELMRDI